MVVHFLFLTVCASHDISPTPGSNTRFELMVIVDVDNINPREYPQVPDFDIHHSSISYPVTRLYEG
jgi:hypothetical protein